MFIEKDIHPVLRTPLKRGIFEIPPVTESRRDEMIIEKCV